MRTLANVYRYVTTRAAASEQTVLMLGLVLKHPSLPAILRPQVLQGHTDEIFSCAFNYEGDYIITGSKDNTCRLWKACTVAE